MMRMVTRVIIRSSDGDESDHQIIRWWSIITLTSAHHCTLHTYQICMSCSFLSLKRPGHYHSPHLSFFMQWSAQYIIRETSIQKIVSSHMKKKHHLHNVKIWPLNKQWERKDYIWKSKLEDLKRSPSPTLLPPSSASHLSGWNLLHFVLSWNRPLAAFEAADMSACQAWLRHFSNNERKRNHKKIGFLCVERWVAGWNWCLNPYKVSCFSNLECLTRGLPDLIMSKAHTI